MSKEWFDYTSEDLQNIDKQKEIFRRMLIILEDKGYCRQVFHRLALILWRDEMN